MLNRSQACAALIVFSSVSFAQEASTPASDAGTQSNETVTSGTNSLIVPSSGLKVPGLAPSSSATDSDQGQKPASYDEAEGFALPGGMGYAPLNFTPGQGSYNRKPLGFSTTVQQGYDDNIYSTSGKDPASPKKGSAITSISEAANLLVAQSRFALSMDANLGAQYYWDRAGDQLTPTGGLDILFGYKVTPRAQLSGIINGVYTTQPSVSLLNGATGSNGNGYFVVNSKFDFLYNWTPRLSSDTTYSANGVYYSNSSTVGNSTTNTIGQSMRYAFSRLVTGVVEGRASQVKYNNITNDANLYYLLVGADLTLSRRLTATGRVGETFRVQDQVDSNLSNNSTMPYAEGALNYALTKTSQLSANLRYGYNDSGSNGTQSAKNTRAGITYSNSITSHLRGTLSVTCSLNEASVNTARQDTIGGTAGLQYDISRDLTLFATYNQIRQFSSVDTQEYTKNVYYLGATYNY